METTNVSGSNTSPRGNASNESSLAALIANNEKEILESWIKDQLNATTLRRELINDKELRDQSTHLLSMVRQALQVTRHSAGINGNEWNEIKSFLNDVSRSRAERGYSPTETAMFVFSLKQPLFNVARREHEKTPGALVQELWGISQLFDLLGLHTSEAFLKSREAVIARQQNEMLELSTPVIQLWHGILALPMIGTLDSSRTQVVTETLLQRIVETGSQVAIIDITGVPTVDTLVAQHLLKTVAAARLMGAECIISGIRPQIAATIVHLGVDLGNIATKASLADAFRLALSKTNQTFSKSLFKQAGSASSPSANA
jgi:rsbT co-antagonist protein RsbR